MSKLFSLYQRRLDPSNRTLPGSGTDDRLVVKPDDLELDGDGCDATRVVLAVTDEYGNLRPFAAGVIRLEARHQYLGKQTVEIRVRCAGGSKPTAIG